MDETVALHHFDEYILNFVATSFAREHISMGSTDVVMLLQIGYTLLFAADSHHSYFKPFNVYCDCSFGSRNSS